VTRHINTLARKVINILIHIAVCLEHWFRRLSFWMAEKRIKLAVAERNMVPSWAETVFPLCAAMIGVLAVYILMILGED